MKHLFSLIVILALAAGACIFFDVAKPTTSGEELRYGVWYLSNYGWGESGKPAAIDHIRWRASELLSD